MPVIFLLIFAVIILVALLGEIAIALTLSALFVAGFFGGSLMLVGLTWVYLRHTYNVLLGGHTPKEPLPRAHEDPAHLCYHGGPAWTDLRTVVGTTWRVCALWALALLPHMVLYLLVVLAYQVLMWACVGFLRGLDTALLRIRRVRMVCPHCFRHLPYPAYRCLCGRRHNTIRPGRRGLVRRLCLCDRAMPTLLLLGSADLSGLCPHCCEHLEHRPGKSRELLLVLFGATGAGKTRLMNGLYLALAQAVEHGPRRCVTVMGAQARRWLDRADTLLDPARRTTPTLPGHRVRGATVRVEDGRDALLLQLYDAAGESFARSDTVGGLTYLGQAHTFLLVVDPLAIDPVWHCLSREQKERLLPDRSVGHHPQTFYERVREEIERQYAMGARAVRRARLAVVVTRGDLLSGTPVAPEGDLERWAADTLGLANLLRSARCHFGRVRVFVTSAVVGTDGRAHPSLWELARWALAQDRGAISTILDASTTREGLP